MSTEPNSTLEAEATAAVEERQARMERELRELREEQYQRGVQKDPGQQRKEFLADLWAMPIANVPHAVDRQVGLLSPLEADIVKKRAQKLMNERIEAHRNANNLELNDAAKVATEQRKAAADLEREYETLAAEMADGLISTKEANDALARLDRRQRSITQKLQVIDDRMEKMLARDEDPEGYFHEFENRYPVVRLSLLGAGSWASPTPIHREQFARMDDPR